MPHALDLNPLPEDWTHAAGDGLRLELTTRYDSRVFDQFFEAYDKAFVLPDEKEERSGFEAALGLNRGETYQRLSRLFAPFREVCLTVHDGKQFVGGANFFATISGAADGEPVLTSNLNYIFIEQGMRGKGYLKRIIVAIQVLIPPLFKADRPLATGLMFVEQNDPFRLTLEQYRLDTEVSGLDQFERLSIWGRAGARIVDHAYVQPPLSKDQEADDTLALSVIGASGVSISACVLRDHLERFFAISVLKGAEELDEGSALIQLKGLSTHCAAGQEVRLFDQLPMLAENGAFDDKFEFWTDERPPSLVAALEQFNTGRKLPRVPPDDGSKQPH
ncbi:MAG: hypothetical protein KJ944_16995 [Alphaproteobacteria bacterium]|nr:hypothetical protein [Alphaproteobacteria bacterium]MBU1563097.1 hypothetical protein [Alphaproteobacteria bacterium]MBU2304291.1 hypothetical protein [Alphaproteobacteria bacterium]MBU2368293.1 hypothetical protein [Alphaproteobacteria bacterium]